MISIFIWTAHSSVVCGFYLYSLDAIFAFYVSTRSCSYDPEEQARPRYLQASPRLRFGLV
jgi:hypothetical protein